MKVLLTGATGFVGRHLASELASQGYAHGAGFLADVCVAWEAALEPARRTGAKTTVLRIGIVLGTEGGALAKMLPVFRLGLGGRIGAGTQWMSWIHVGDLRRFVSFV